MLQLTLPFLFQRWSSSLRVAQQVGTRDVYEIPVQLTDGQMFHEELLLGGPAPASLAYFLQGLSLNGHLEEGAQHQTVELLCSCQSNRHELPNWCFASISRWYNLELSLLRITGTVTVSGPSEHHLEQPPVCLHSVSVQHASTDA